MMSVLWKFQKYFLFIKIVFYLFLFSGCKNFENKKASTAFYFWRTRFNLNNFEKKSLSDLNVSNLYIKILDIDCNNDENFPIPVGEIDSFPNTNEYLKITPVIFITNRTFTNISENLIDSFANVVLQKCFSYPNFFSVEELQFDCDWTETTRHKYFSFLEKIKSGLNKSENKNISLSATIRLYPYKYFEKTGVPPVKSGMLMVYNLEALDAPETINSILDIENLKNYLTSNKNYPILLDIALPLYSQGVILRDGRAAHLFNNLNLVELETDSNFLKKTATTFKIKQNCYFKGVYIYADDILRLDQVSIATLEASAELLSKKFEGKVHEICFFSLDSVCLKRNNPVEIKKIMKNF